MTFSDKLRALIEDGNLTQKRVAQELHIPVSTLGGYVQGTSEPDFLMLKQIAEYFAVTTDYLLDHKIKPSHDREAQLLDIFRSLSPRQQELYLEQGSAIIKVYSK